MDTWADQAKREALGQRARSVGARSVCVSCAGRRVGEDEGRFTGAKTAHVYVWRPSAGGASYCVYCDVAKYKVSRAGAKSGRGPEPGAPMRDVATVAMRTFATKFKAPRLAQLESKVRVRAHALVADSLGMLGRAEEKGPEMWRQFEIREQAQMQEKQHCLPAKGEQAERQS